MNNHSTALRGEVLVSVINADGSVAAEYPAFRNIWLDQGLDNLATLLIPDAFAACAKGLGQTPTKEVPHVSNTYSYTGGQITRNTSPATPRDFVVGDIGTLFRFNTATPTELMITGVVSTTVATASPVGANPIPADFATKAATVYKVNLQGLTAEAFQTQFGGDTATKVDAVPTITASAAIFNAGHIGKAILIFPSTPDAADGFRFLITAVPSTTTATVSVAAGAFAGRGFLIYTPQPGDTALTPLSRTETYSAVSGENSTTDTKDGGGHLTGERVLKRTFVFSPEPTVIKFDSSAGSPSTYGWTGTTVTRASGAHNFLNTDIGEYIKFTNGEFCVVVSVTSTTIIAVDRAPANPHVGDTFIQYGFNQYDSICLSNSDDPSPTNANILVRFEDGSGNAVPVNVGGENPEFPGQQLKVTYICHASVTPGAISGRTAAPIQDPGHVMSTNKFGTYVVEAIALATIDTAGNTQDDFSVLEPSEPGNLALSPVSVALGPFVSPDRSAGSVNTAMAGLGYIDGQFTQLYEGTFGINDAIATNWRSLGIFDINANSYAFTFLFEANQAKTGNVTLTVRFRKSWNRDLS